MEEKIPLSSRLWLAGADGTCAILSGLVTGGGMTYFFTKWMGLSPAKASVVWLLFGIWNAVNDPLFGFISDKTKSKIGRRMPYIRYGAPVYAAVFILCWVVFPYRGNQNAMFIQMFVTLFLFDALYTAIATALYVMPFEMAVSNKARGSIFIWKIVFSLISLAVPLVVMPLIQPDPGESPRQFQLIMGGIGIFAGIIIFCSTFFYGEKSFIKEQEQFPFLKSLLTCFKNLPFILFEVLSFSVIYIQTSLMQGVLYYFAELQVPMALCYGAMVLGALIGIILWVKKQTVWGIKKCLMLMCGTFAAGAFLMAFFGGNPVIAAFGFLTAGFGFSGGMYLIPLMNGDVIDWDEYKTSLRREGMYAGVNSFITKPAISIAQAAFLSIITAFGYVQSAPQGMQSETAKNGILIAWMLVPAILLVICFIAAYFYPLEGKDWLQKKHQLEETHREKEQQYLHSLGYTE